MSKENEYQHAREQEIKNQKYPLGKIPNPVIKLTHENELKIEIYDEEEASIEPQNSSDYDILKEIGDNQHAITPMERISARQLMESRKEPIKRSLKDPDTLSIIVQKIW